MSFHMGAMSEGIRHGGFPRNGKRVDKGQMKAKCWTMNGDLALKSYLARQNSGRYQTKEH